MAWDSPPFWMSGRSGSPLDLFAAGADLGIDRCEISGIDSDKFYDEICPGDFHLISLHDPAPPARGHRRMGSKELRCADIEHLYSTG